MSKVHYCKAGRAIQYVAARQELVTCHDGQDHSQVSGTALLQGSGVNCVGGLGDTSQNLQHHLFAV